MESARLHELFDDAWAFQLREDPLLATSVGEHAYNDRLTSVNAASQERRAEYWRGVLERLSGIDRSALEGEDAISYASYHRLCTCPIRQRISQ